MQKFLHILEYSDSSPEYKIPVKENKHYDTKYRGSLIRSFIDSNKYRVKENIDYTFDDSIVEEKTIPLIDVVVYDDKDYKEQQEIAYVYECPICLSTIVTSNNNLNFCPHCENNKFAPELIALINTEQMEDIAIDHDDVSDLIIVKDDKVVYKENKREE